MIDRSEKRNRQLAFELQHAHVCEKRSKLAYTMADETVVRHIFNILFADNITSRRNSPYRRPFTPAFDFLSIRRKKSAISALFIIISSRRSMIVR